MSAYFTDRVTVPATSSVEVVAADPDIDRDVFIQGGGGLGFTQAQAEEPGIAVSDVFTSGARLLLPADEGLWIYNPAGSSIELVVLVTKARSS